MIEKITPGNVPAGSIPLDTAPNNSAEVINSNIGTLPTDQVSVPEKGGYDMPAKHTGSIYNVSGPKGAK